MTAAAATLSREGRVWLRGLLDAQLLTALDALGADRRGAGLRLGGGAHALAETAARISDALAEDPLQVARVVMFAKEARRNWTLPWHQDRVIAVEARHEAPGCTNWTRKQQIWHCEPPYDVLNAMFFVRLHLDDIGPGDGPMEIAPGSHTLGIVGHDDAGTQALNGPTEICTAARGATCWYWRC